jgi:hypothetical protein
MLAIRLEKELELQEEAFRLGLIPFVQERR